RILSIFEGGAAEKAGLRIGDVITAIGDKPITSYTRLLEDVRGRKAGDKVKVKATRGGKAIEVELTFAARSTGQRGQGGPLGQRGGGGGRGGPGAGAGDPTRPFAAQLGGQQENVQDQQGRDGPQYGGVYKSTDGGESWTRLNSINPRPMYFSQVRV